MTLKQLLGSIDKKEWLYIALVSLALIIITSLPYLYAYWQTPDNYFYRGVHAITPGDINVYYSYINQIKAGNYLIKDLFTSETQTSGLLNILWLGVGLLARIFNLGPALAFHLARIIFIPIFLSSAYILTSYFFIAKNQRKITLLFLAFASGIGAYFAGIIDKLYPSVPGEAVYRWPIDLWIADSNIFLTLYQSPHFIASLSLMVWFFLLLLLAWDSHKYLYSLGAGLIGLLWFNFHPYYAPYAYVLIFAYALILALKNKTVKPFFYCCLTVFLSLPSVLYHYWKIKTDFVIGLRATQNIVPTPPFIFVFLGFGFIFILAVLAVWWLIKNKKLWTDNRNLFLSLWFIGGLISCYWPSNFQAKFLLGLQIPMTFLAMIFFYSILPKLEHKYPKRIKFWRSNPLLLAFLLLILFGFSIIFNLTRDIYYAKAHSAIYYLPLEFKEAAKWLDENNPDDKIIFSQEFLGYQLPALANQRVYLGHGHETVLYQAKKQLVTDFFANKFSLDQARQFLKANNSGFVVDFAENKDSELYDFTKESFLKPVFSGQIINIYQVIN